MSRNTSILLLLATGVIWSTGGFVIKLITWSPLAIAGLRSGLTFIVIVFYRWPRGMRIGLLTFAGSIFYALMVICFVLANKMTTAGNVILIQFAAPLYVAIFGFSFLGEKSSKLDYISIAIIILGLVFFFIEDLSFNQFWGNILALISGIGFAGLTMCMRKQKDDNPIDSILIGNLLTFILCAPSYLDMQFYNLNNLVMITYLGVIQLGISYIIYSKVIQYVKALDAIIFTVIEPIINPVLAYLFLNESMSGLSIFGGTLVVSGVVTRELISSKFYKKNKTK